MKFLRYVVPDMLRLHDIRGLRSVGTASGKLPFSGTRSHAVAVSAPPKMTTIDSCRAHAWGVFRGQVPGTVPFSSSSTAPDGARRRNGVPRTVLIVGSGGLSIGQAGEFDYSGSQAIKALREEGIRTILVNPNIATIQTSSDLADKIYFLPVSSEFLELIIAQEAPEGILLTFGGQSALNVGIALDRKGIFERYGVRVLGTPIRTLELTEDRDLFAKALKGIQVSVAESTAVHSVNEALEAADSIGFPVIVRSAYCLGGLGSGFANTPEELRHLATQSLSLSPQILVERSMKGWKEIEYEVVRDAADNCITVCNMENFDPLGIHTGDSIVIAPSQTLSDEEYHMLRSTAIKIVKHLGVVGECNVQYALCPTSLEYAVIEVNARLSRSSALASKATGYPLAFVAAKLSLGSSLPDLKNAVTKTTTANFEPSMDYVVTKIPRWDLRKFQHVARGIGSSMKSVGEVMAVGRSWEESLQKAIRMVDPGSKGFEGTLYEPSDLDEALRSPTDNRLAIIGHAMIDKAYSVDTIHSLTKIDKWFLYKLENIVKMRREVSACVSPTISIPASVLARAKKLGFSDFQIAELVGTSEVVVRNHRKALGIIPYVKRIDTLASEFPAATNYLYTTYNASTHDVDFEERGVLVLGSGVYRIGSSVEFDWCGVSCIRSLRQLGHRTIMINYNPETVSTDFDECDRLYFEELSLERTLDIYELENASGCIVSVGGQLPQNIAMSLQAQGVHVFGTNPVMLDRCEDREKFSSVMDNIGVDQPAWKTLTSKDDALVFALEVGYPVLVRPSYVLSGAAMNVAYTANELSRFLQMAIAVSPHHPIVVTKFIQNAQELDVDAVASNGDLVVYSLAQHIENAGVHSGDATLILPPLMPGDAPIGHERWGLQPISFSIVDDVREITRKVAKAFQITGPFNMQLILERGNRGHSLKMIECNLRASRSFPFSSKVLGVNFIDLATRALVGHPSLEVEKPSGDLMLLRRPYKAVKVPVFSWTRLAGADPSLGVEMASTGEVACFGRDAKEAFLLAHMSNHNNFEELPMGAGSSVVFTMDELTNLEEAAYVAGKLHGLDYRLLVDVKENQERLLSACDDSSLTLGLLVPSAPDAASLVKVLQDRRLSKEIFGGVSLVLSFCQIRPLVQVDVGYLVRRSAVDFGIGLLNEPKSAMVLADALVDYLTGAKTKAESVRDWGSWINV